MKHLRVTARVDPDLAPTFYNLLANSAAIAETRVLDWNTTLEEVDTVLFAIDGDPTPFAERATDTPGIESVEFSNVAGSRTYALAVVRPLETPMFEAIHRARTRPGLVVRKPIVYRDGDMYFRVVGDPEPLQNALAGAPEAMDVRIDEIGSFRGEPDVPHLRLSERQREALSVAHDLGYYDQPRGATHEDVAEELGCAPPTASEHLQKAEAKLVDAALDEFGPQV